MSSSLLHQIKERRLKLGLRQKDMMMRIGVSRQQYQRLETRGNPQLETLELIAKGLNSELMLIPKEKVGAVASMLEQVESVRASQQNLPGQAKKACLTIHGRIFLRMSNEPSQCR